MAIFNKSTPPIFDAISDATGRLTATWVQWFSGRQTYDNSIQARWVPFFTSGLVTVDTVTIERVGTSGEQAPFVFPAGSRVMVIDTGAPLYGSVAACTYDSGTTTAAWVLTIDGGTALSAVSAIYYSVLTSTVIS